MAVALNFFDGFDHVNPTIGDKWTAAGQPTADANTPFGFGRAVVPPAVFGSHFRALGANYQSIIMSGYFYSGTAGSNSDIMLFTDGAPSAQSVVQVGLRLNPMMEWQVRSGTNILATAADNGATDTWYHVCMAAHIHNSAGRVHVWINGQLVISENNIDTQNTANNYATAVQVAHGTQGSRRWDDVACWTGDSYTVSTDVIGTFGANGDFPGAARVITLWPDAVGNSSQWTASSAGDNFADVDETVQDEDTTYVSSSTVNHVDTYGHEALPFDPEKILAVQVVNTARIDDAGSGEIKPILRSGTTDYEGDAKTLSASYLAKVHIWEGDPDNGDAEWTKTTVDATEIGQKLTVAPT